MFLKKPVSFCSALINEVLTITHKALSAIRSVFMELRDSSGGSSGDRGGGRVTGAYSWESVFLGMCSWKCVAGSIVPEVFLGACA